MIGAYFLALYVLGFVFVLYVIVKANEMLAATDPARFPLAGIVLFAAFWPVALAAAIAVTIFDAVDGQR